MRLSTSISVRALRHPTLGIALVIAAPMLTVALFLAPGALASSSVVHQAGKAVAAPPSLTLSIAERPHDPSELTLVARLRGSSAGAGKSVTFFVVSREFKQPMRIPIGTAKTAADGRALIRYKPTWAGRQVFVAQLAGAHPLVATSSHYVSASAPGKLSPGANPPRPLASVGNVFLRMILSVVALIWLALLAVLALVGTRMPHMAHEGID